MAILNHIAEGMIQIPIKILTTTKDIYLLELDSIFSLRLLFYLGIKEVFQLIQLEIVLCLMEIQILFITRALLV